ncbi:hypothetical protein KF728_16785 [Candidatus Obscuribacterales bacterium]|nr:hypothetical protein [Candidatus Obscuribacterales bacterium]
MVEMKSEVQSNPTGNDQFHPNLERNIFESAYSGQMTKGEDTRLAFNSTTARPPSDGAWPPPLQVADTDGNILTRSSEKQNNDGAKAGEPEGHHSAEGPKATEEKPPEKPAEKPTDTTAEKTADKPTDTSAEKPADKPADTSAEKPTDAQGDKSIDPSLPPELQNEAALMKNLTGPQKTLVETAFKAVGTPLWAASEYADITGNGRYGCAASESIVKQRAGYDYADSPLVSGLVNQLQKNGWTKHPFDERQPGDTIIRHKAGQHWKKGGGNAHIGTVGADINFAYNNNSDSATWSYKPINESFSPRSKRFVLRPPVESETLVAKGR